jgi:hypothetical protein
MVEGATQFVGPTAAPTVAQYPLLDALINRRSRRFAAGSRLNGGPLAYASVEAPQPLSLAEEAALAFAASGVTGCALADLPYESGSVPEGSDGNIMVQFVGRTIPSADAVHGVVVFMLNDDGAWMLKRPHDYPRRDVASLVQAAREHKLVELYEKSRVRISDRRPDLPRELPWVPTMNKWSTNVPGSTYFLPVNEYTALYINVLLTVFNEDWGYFAIDERNRFRPAGLAKFGRSKGGHLHDDPRDGRVATVGFVDSIVSQLVTIEEGAIIQSLALMTQALGLGGFPHLAGLHPCMWLQALGFRMEEPRFSRVMGAGPVMTALLRAVKKDLPMPTAVGLERDGEVLLKPFCPPYYRNMEEAVLAFVDYKYASGQGAFRDGGEATAWRDGARVQAGIPKYTDRAIAAAIAYCDYIFTRYGRFPAPNGPFQLVMGYQAHHLDSEFYERFYRPDALSDTQRVHAADGHDGRAR